MCASNSGLASRSPSSAASCRARSFTHPARGPCIRLGPVSDLDREIGELVLLRESRHERFDRTEKGGELSRLDGASAVGPLIQSY